VESKLTAEIAMLHTKIDGVEARLDARIDKVDARIDLLDVKFDSVESRLATKIDHLDRDIHALVKRVFPEES